MRLIDRVGNQILGRMPCLIYSGRDGAVGFKINLSYVATVNKQSSSVELTDMKLRLLVAVLIARYMAIYAVSPRFVAVVGIVEYNRFVEVGQVTLIDG